MLSRIIVAAALVAVALAVTCPACDSAVCEVAQCGGTAPYYCDAGMSKGGCAANPNAWNDTKMCTSCCDTSNCSNVRFKCNATCPTAVCDSTKRCSFAAPFMCTSGTAANGCSTSAQYWPTHIQCDSCCDVTSCEYKCAPCSAAQCAATPCTASNPYTCTAGPLKGGCSASSTYFGEQSQCYACCDASACPTLPPMAQ